MIIIYIQLPHELLYDSLDVVVCGVVYVTKCSPIN